MVEHISLHPRAESDLTLSDLRKRSGTSLPTDLLRDISRRLQFICILLLGLTVINSIMFEVVGFEANRAIRYTGLAVAVFVNLTVFFLARSGKVTAGRLLNLGMAYEVVLAAVLSYSTVELTWFTSVRAGFILSPVAIWILIFPMVVPNTTQKTLIASVAAALTEPMTVVLLVAAGVGGMPTLGGFVRNLWPTVVAIVIAVAIARLIYGLGEEISRARAMGSYKLTSLLGRGGMGEVWRGKHRLLSRDAAVKLIRPRELDSTDESRALTVLKRFEREVQATAVLRSPHTIEVYDYGIAQDGTFYYVMELLNGLDLQDLAEKFGPQPAGRVVHILKQACHSLHEAHVGGLIHRDIKPSNLFLCRYGLDADFIKVLDFGIVKQDLGHDDDGRHLTEVGMVSGTPAYLAPEQAAEGKEPDGRADLYALGCVGYWLLTKQLVFDKMSPMAFVVAHSNDEPPPISTRTSNEVPSDLEDVIMSCLAKDPNDRPRDAMELARRLGSVAAANAWTQETADEWWVEHATDLEIG